MKSKKLKKIIAIAIVSSITSTLMPVAASAQWLQNSTNNWSWTESGEKTTGWKQVEGTWYYFDNNGDMKTGWVQSADSKWYYLNSNGAMKTGWLQESDGKWYKLGSDGAMRTGWVQESDGNWYKLSTSGAMQTGWIQDSDNKWYFASSSGEMQTGVIQVDGKPYALSQTGDMLVGTNVSTEGNIYTTDANGVIIQGNSSNRGIEFNKKGDPLAQGEGSGDGKQSTTTSNTQSSNTDTTTTKNNDNNSRHHNSSINITKINELNDINVANGTELSKINLPSNVTVKLDNDKEISVPVIWNGGNSNYNKNISGTYTFSGTLKLPSGIKNSSNLKATINVNVGAAGVTKKSLASIRSLPDVNVSNGTPLHELSLPRNVRITLSDNTTTSAAVTWDEGTPTYDGSVSGTYTFIGQLALPDDITNPNNLTATVNVNVASANTGDREVLRVRPVSDINVNNGTSLENLDLPNRVHLTLGDNTTTSAAVTWDEGTPTYDGSVAGTYIFSGELTLPEGITNPNNLKAIAQANVASAEIEKSVIGINPIQDINVSNGTSLDAANLPSDVIVRLDDHTTTSAAVTWDEGTPTYDESAAGTYIFSGELTLPEGITNANNLKAIVQVNVAAADTQRSVVSVDIIPNITVNNGTSLDAANLPSDVIVRLDDHTTTSAAVTWNEGTPIYNGEAAGTYRFDGTLTLPEGITNPNNLKATVNVIVANPMIATGMTVIVEPKTTPQDGRVMLTVTPGAEDANHKVYYRISYGQPTPMNVGAVINLSDWTELSDTLPHEISAENGMYVEVVEVTTDDNKVTKWGKSSEINDGYVAPTVPTAKVSNLTFTDTDVTAREMGGTLTWTAPTDESNVTSYAVYSSTDGTTKGEQIGRDVAVGTNQLVIPADTEYTPYVIVVAKNAVGEAECANYSSVRVTDVALTAPTVTVWDLTFTDADTDTNQIGGILRWTEPTDVSNVTSYAVYTSVDGRTKGGQIGEDVPVGTNQLVIPENTLYTPHIIVVTKNAAGESRFFTGILVRDLAPTVPTAKVSNLAFTDTDNDLRQMGGTLTWNAPTDESNVTGYAVYASTDGTTKGAQIGSDVSKGTNQLVIPADTEYTPYIIVVAKNAIGEAVSSNYAKIGVTDVMPTAVIVSNDSVAGATAGDSKVTGLISGRLYKITDNSTGISEYTKADGTLTADVSQEAVLGEGITEITGLNNGATYKVEEEITIKSVAQLNDITVVNGTQLDSLELPSKVIITLSDNRAIDAGITWDVASVNYQGDVDGTYTFYGTIELPIGVINPSNLNTKVDVIVSKNIALNKTATASAAEDSNQAASKAVDGSIDSRWCTTNPGDNWLELDLGKSYEIGRWVVKHAHAGRVDGAYQPVSQNTRDFKLQESTDGTNWTDVDSVAGNTADITDRNVTPFTTRYVRLYVTNPVQTREWAVARIYEFELYKDQNPTVPTAKVSDLAFTDTDNDSRQMGGTLTWTAPTDVSNVTSYAVYASADGTTKGAQIGSDVAVGTNQLVIPENTAYAQYIIVVAKNATGEAVSDDYASIAVTDVIPAPPQPVRIVGYGGGDNGMNDDGKSNVTVIWTDSVTSTVDHYEIVAKLGSRPSVSDVLSGYDNIGKGVGRATFEWNSGEIVGVGVVAVDGNGQKTLCTTFNSILITSDLIIRVSPDGHTPVVPTAKVSDLAFTDTDNDASQMGGTLTWTAPTDVSNVTSYAVYASADGTTKGAQIGSDVAVGTNQLVIPENTAYAQYIIVVAKNATGEAEQANYANIRVMDVAPTLTAPTLVAQSNANVDNDIEITFTDNEAWRNAVTDVKIDDQSVESGNWTLSAGKLTLTTHKAGSKTIKVIATGYKDATIAQDIASGNLSSTESTVTIAPTTNLPNGDLLSAGYTSNVIITAKDKYDNPISNKQVKLNMYIKIKNANFSTNEIYTIGGNQLGSYSTDYQTGLLYTLSITEGGQGNFEIAIPNQVDAGDGFSIDIYQVNNECPIGSQISFYK